MSRKGRADAMSQAIKTTGLSPGGADWLTLRLDPYHDFNRPIAGYPDADSLDTVVSVNNYELNVSQPGALGANWDAHIFTLPLSYVFAVNNGGFDATQNFVETANSYSLGLVNISKDAAGGPLFPTANPVASGNFSMAAVAPFNEVSNGVSRVIGLGIEIIDTTAEIYKQGSLTAYQMPECTLESTQFGNLNAAGTVQTQGIHNMLVTPPSLVTEAVLYRSSVQWEAKEGAYISVGQEGVNNPFRMNTYEGLAITPNGQLTTGQSMATINTVSTAPQAAPLLTASRPAYNYKSVNATQSGVILSGLDSHATFKIRVRVYVERAPTRSETDLIPLATPSADYDPVALRLYSQLSAVLPIAVPVGFNAHGDWWRMIVNALKSIIPVVGTVLTPILGPEAGVIGSAVGALIPSQKVGRKNTAKIDRVKRVVQRVNRNIPRGPV